MKIYFNKLRYIILVALLINPVIFSMESSDNDNLDPEAKKQLELREHFLVLPKDMQMLILQYFWWNLKQYMTSNNFKDEEEIIELFNAFNCASKLTNQLVKMRLSLDKNGLYNDEDLVVRFAKRFTFFKFNMIAANIYKDVKSYKDHEILVENAYKLKAYKWSQREITSSYKNYLYALNDFLIREYRKYENSKDKDLSKIKEILKLGANPNTKIVETFIERPIILYAVARCDIDLTKLLLEFNADTNIETYLRDEGIVTSALKEFFKHRPSDEEAWADILILLLKNGVKPLDNRCDRGHWVRSIEKLNVSDEAEVSEYTFNWLSQERSFYKLRKYLSIVFKTKRIRNLLKANFELI